MDIGEIKQRLSKVVNPDFQWPDVPLGWQLEFIAYSNTEVDMDLLHPISGVFWSEDNDRYEPPTTLNGAPITATELKNAGVPYMTTFGTAAVSDAPRALHLSVIHTTR